MIFEFTVKVVSSYKHMMDKWQIKYQNIDKYIQVFYFLHLL